MTERLTLQDLIDLLSDELNMTKKDSETFLRELIALVSETIESKDFVRIKDFGTFKLSLMSARKSVDVNTGAAIEIPAHYKLSFTPDKLLRDGVNSPFAHFESVLLEDGITFEDEAREIIEAQTEQALKEKELNSEPIIIEDVKEDPIIVNEPRETIQEENIIGEPIEGNEEKQQELLDKFLQDESKIILGENKPIFADENELANIKITLEEAEEGLQEIVEDTILEEEAKEEFVEEQKIELVEEVLVETEEQIQEQEPIISAEKTNYNSEDEDIDSEDAKYRHVDYEKISRRKNIFLSRLGMIILIIAVAGALVWGYFKYLANPVTNPEIEDHDEIVIIEENEIADSPILDVEKKDSRKVEKKSKDDPSTIIQEIEEKIEAAEPQVIVVKGGQTLRSLGGRYYGNDSFWVYIFEENRAKIKRPNALNAGMKLIIPPAEKYNIDAKDPQSVRKAKLRESELFREFRD